MDKYISEPESISPIFESGFVKKQIGILPSDKNDIQNIRNDINELKKVLEQTRQKRTYSSIDTTILKVKEPKPNRPLFKFRLLSLFLSTVLFASLLTLSIIMY